MLIETALSSRAAIVGRPKLGEPDLPTMSDSEEYPLMTVGELARALRVPREFVFRHASELGAICLRLPDANVNFVEV